MLLEKTHHDLMFIYVRDDLIEPTSQDRDKHIMMLEMDKKIQYFIRR